jgi:hypothetical protein
MSYAASLTVFIVLRNLKIPLNHGNFIFYARTFFLFIFDRRITPIGVNCDFHEMSEVGKMNEIKQSFSINV